MFIRLRRILLLQHALARRPPWREDVLADASKRVGYFSGGFLTPDFTKKRPCTQAIPA